jgi:hypothetical protein
MENMATCFSGEFREIKIECDFTLFNDLLYLADEERAMEEASGALAEAISHPSEDEYQVVHLHESGGLLFWKYLFALQLTCVADEEGNRVFPEEPCYYLRGYADMHCLFPDFLNCPPPKEKAHLAQYYNLVLAMQYHLYLDLQKRMKPLMAPRVLQPDRPASLCPG